MENASASSPLDGMQHLKPHENGYLNDVLSVFNARQHPFILVEESAMRWMAIRIFPEEDLDLLIRDSEIEAIKADLLATGQYELVEQNLKLRFSDTYTQQVPRLQLKTGDGYSYKCISLWSESVYMLNVGGEKLEVPDLCAWNVVLMEERFDLDPSWAQASSIGYTTRITNGVKILPSILAQSAGINHPIYIPTIPRILDALLHQAHHRVLYPENFPGLRGNRPVYHLQNFIRYLHLEKPQQWERICPELAEQNRGRMEVFTHKFKRKPLVTLASLQK